MAGIDQLSKLVDSLIAVVSAEEKLRACLSEVSIDQLALEGLDADEQELEALAQKFQALDLKDDMLEARVRAIVAAAPKPVAFVLKLLKLVFPKKV